MTCDARNLNELFAALDVKFPELKSHLRDEAGEVRRFLNIYVNDEDIRFLGGRGIFLSGRRRGAAGAFDCGWRGIGSSQFSELALLRRTQIALRLIRVLFALQIAFRHTGDGHDADLAFGIFEN